MRIQVLPKRGTAPLQLSAHVYCCQAVAHLSHLFETYCGTVGTRILYNIIFCPVSSSFYRLLFSSPNLSRRRFDVYHTSTHGTLYDLSANLGCRSEFLKRAARGSLKIQDAKIRHAPSHNFVGLGLYLRNSGTYRQSEKNLLNSNISSICPYNMVNFGPLAAEICWRVWGTPANFNGFRVLASLLHGSTVVGVSQTLRR